MLKKTTRWITAALNWFCIARKYPDMIKGSDVGNMVKAVLSAAVMFAVMYVIYNFLSGRFEGLIGNIVICALCAAAGVVVYGVLLLVTGEEDIKNILRKRG